MPSTSASGTRVAVRLPETEGLRSEALNALAANETDGPIIEVNDSELFEDDGDDEPYSRERRSVTGHLPARAKAACALASESDRALRDLLRTARFLSAEVQGACARSTEHMRELESLDVALQQQADDYRRLYQRVQELELALRDERAEAARDREYVASQLDAFIFELLTEHEQVEKSLRERLAEQERLNKQLTERLAGPVSQSESLPR